MRVYQRRKAFSITTALFVLVGIFALPTTAFAQVLANYDMTGLGTRSPVDIILTIINWFLSILAIVAVVLIIYAGYLWMTSGGNEEKVKKAKRILISTGIGLVIILASWGIVQYVFGILGYEGGTVEGGDYGGGGGGYLETGNPFHISSTDPQDDELNVVLCQAITVGFSLPIDTEIAAEMDGEEYVNFSLKVKGGGFNGDACTENAECASGVCDAGACIGEQVPGIMAFSENSKYLVFYSNEDFLQNTDYRVELSTDIVAIPEEGGNALSSTDPKRLFEFTTGEETDEIPPQVAVTGGFLPYPADGEMDVCRETGVQVTFTESLDVTSVNNTSVWLYQAPLGEIPHSELELSSAAFSALEDGNADTDDTNNTFTIYPTATLDADTWYGVSLYSGDAANNFDGAIRDTCGNPLDGDFSLTAEGSTQDDFLSPTEAQPPIDIGFEYPWTWRTGQTAECTPVIDAIAPGNGFYSEDYVPQGVTDPNDTDLVTITGAYLYPFTNLTFENNISAAVSNCFDVNHNPTMSCVVSGSPSQVVVRTPVGSVTGTLGVENESGSAESSEYTVKSPFIYALSPNEGPVGQFITIRGRNFNDNAVGKVYFDGIEAELPCADGWDDDEIIVQVPDDFAVGDFPTVQIQRLDGKWSNQAGFRVTAGEPGPGLCALAPNCSDTGDVDVTLEGVGFGTDGDVFFNDNVANVQTYSETTILTDSTPVNEFGTYEVGVVVNSAPSNGIFFEIPCGDVGVPRVKSSSTCDLENDTYPTPNPRPGEEEVCLSSIISVEFENVDEMNMSTTGPGLLNPEMFAVYECVDQTCTDKTAISGQRINHMSTLNLGVRFIPNSDYKSATWYQVVISGDVQSSEGIRMGSDYIWTFRTQEGTGACPLSAIDVWPDDYTFRATNIRWPYQATPYSENCSELNPYDYSWAWNNSNPLIIRAFYPRGPQINVKAAGGNAENQGTAILSATANGITGEEPVTVDLGLCSTDEHCESVCPGSVCDLETNRCTPVITNVDPEDGAQGNWITVEGCFFGPDPGTLYLNDAEQPLPDAGICGDTWSNEQIIFEISETAANGPAGIRVNSTWQFDSNTVNFTVNDTVRPGLCQLNPDTGYAGDQIELVGNRFGTGSGACETAYQSHHENPVVRAVVNTTVSFFNTYVAPIRALAGDCQKPVGAQVQFQNADASGDDFFQWIENYITTLVPTDAITGRVSVLSDSGELSNGIDFTVACENDAQCPDGFICDLGNCVAKDWCDTDADCNACEGSTCDEDTQTCTPVIESISPDSGPEGRTITVSGCYFGAVQGDSIVTVDDIEALNACGGSSWTNDYAIVEIPSGITGDSNDQMDVVLNKDVDGTVFNSNAVKFTESANCVDVTGIPVPTTGIPKLCTADPVPTSRNQDIHFEGDSLGDQYTGGTINFTSLQDSASSASVNYTNPASGTVFNHSVDTQTPVTSPNGYNEVTAVVESCPSNGLPVMVDGRPRVLSTDPDDAATEVCLNGQASVTFTAAMDYVSLRDNIEVETVGGEAIAGTLGAYTNDDGFTVAYFNQEELFPSDTEIVFRVTGDADINDVVESGVLSAEGLGMEGDYSFTFRTSPSTGPCEIDRVDVVPASHTFTVGGTAGTQLFAGEALDADGHVLVSVASYGWDWAWEVLEGTESLLTISAPDQRVVDVYANENGTTSLFATATVQGSGEEFYGFANIVAFFCEDPREFSGFMDENHYFETRYCADDYNEISFEESDFVTVPNPAGGALDEWFLLSNTEDAIGFRVFGNGDRLNIEDWFAEEAPNPDASTSGVVVDGYDGLQVGRTTYVGASNFVSNGSAYPNVYLMSYNQEASEETKQIFSDLLENLRFNVNDFLNDKDREYVRKDTIRITDLGSMALDLEEYYKKHDEYPRLESGTYVKYLSTSTWPSWKSTLGNALGIALPEDPENVFGDQGSLCDGDQFEGETCYNSEAKLFECPADSSVYLYRVSKDGDEFWLYSRLDMSNKSGWVNFTGDACSSVENAECPCFDYEIGASGGDKMLISASISIKDPYAIAALKPALKEPLEIINVSTSQIFKKIITVDKLNILYGRRSRGYV